jgi:type III pantothenate kinase
MLRVVADLGNTRLKWGRLDQSGRLVETIALPLDDPAAWASAWDAWVRLDPDGSWWAVSTVNPPVAARLEAFFRTRGVERVTWVRAAAEVPVPKDVEGAETGGSDRALAVFGALRRMPTGRAGLVVMCGTAITVERVTAAGIWQGGAIAPGLGLTARALHLMTAQLPLIRLDRAPPPWGRGTQASLEAGVFWGIVGAVRELLVRQEEDLGRDPWVIWTGGDAALLAPPLFGDDARIEPNLILFGLSEVVFGTKFAGMNPAIDLPRPDLLG